MNDSISSIREQQLLAWYNIIADYKEAKASGIKITDWLKSQDISRDTYYYWHGQVKNAYYNKSLPDIVPVSNELSSAPDTTCSSSPTYTLPMPHDTPRSSIRLCINGISIDVSELSDPNLLTNVIKAVRYA